MPATTPSYRRDSGCETVVWCRQPWHARALAKELRRCYHRPSAGVVGEDGTEVRSDVAPRDVTRISEAVVGHAQVLVRVEPLGLWGDHVIEAGKRYSRNQVAVICKARDLRPTGIAMSGVDLLAYLGEDPRHAALAI